MKQARVVLIGFILLTFFIWGGGVVLMTMGIGQTSSPQQAPLAQPQNSEGVSAGSSRSVVPLTEMEHAKLDNILLREQILQRDYRDFSAAAFSAHKLNPEAFRLDVQAYAFIPVFEPPAPPIPSPVTPKKK